jgi:hypothetical protein
VVPGSLRLDHPEHIRGHWSGVTLNSRLLDYIFTLLHCQSTDELREVP